MTMFEKCLDIYTGKYLARK